MTVKDAILNRRTVRGFKSEAIPEEKLREILDNARWSPSNSNTQPWHLSIVSGDALKALKKDLLKHVMFGAKQTPHWGSAYDPLEGVYKERQYDCADRYYSSMDIKREDKMARNQLALRNFGFFDAPHAGFITMPENMNATNALDIGIFLQSFMLLLTEAGYGSVPQGALAFFPEPVFEHLNFPEGHKIIVGISFGIPDPDAQINSSKMPRLEVDAFTDFYK